MQTQLTFVPTLFCYVKKIKNKKLVNNCRRRCILKSLQKTQKNLKNSQNMKNFEKNHGSKKSLKFIFTYTYQVSKTSNHKWNISPLIKKLPLIYYNTNTLEITDIRTRNL